jgi:YfiH family protein
MTFPPVPDPFYWAESACGPVLRCRPLDAIARHAFTTRQLRLGSHEAWEQVAAELGVAEVVTLNQVHGRAVLSVRRGHPRQPDRSDADAILSNDPSVGVAVRAADCVPVLLADAKRGVVGAIHAGWRGTAAGVAPAAVTALAREFGSQAGDLAVAIGPSIGPCCYEVGTDLVDAFAAAGHPRHLIDRWFLAPAPRRGERLAPKLRLDVAGANRDQLMLAGVSPERIFACGLCTAEHLDVLTSFRAEKDGAVRLAGAIAPGPGASVQ